MKLFKTILIFTIFQISASNFWASGRLPEEIQEMLDMMSAVDSPRYPGFRNFYRYSVSRYNCSGKNHAEWYETGVKRFGWGIYYISSGLLFQVIGWPVLYIFFTKIKMKAYIVMIFIGVIEITEVWGNSIWPGFVALLGEVYCTSPQIMTIVGKVTMVQWILGSATAVFLGIHRLLSMINFGESLINTNAMISFWLAFLTIYAIYGSLFFDTVLFNSDYMAPLLDPMTEQEGVTYSNNFLYFHNISAAVLLVTVYTSLCLVWRFREVKNFSAQAMKFQKSLLLQSICISLTYAVPAISFVTLYFFVTPKWFSHASDISYQLSGGIPFIMYIVLNNTVREEIFSCCKKNPASSQVKIHSTTVHSFN
ncbi:Serpentine Receptor, class T [Caenorhabditis elegans]|uniref:Serpentine Receptor, class T n=1 Tax=Caenorhabditis elegans TaxID=6239 RepID=Q9TXW8_CAEEL|nr:Serpentine Receptor, class T [Caenorhabditis elegans]CCD67823.2 Serpentine Receptor, class T [Caenorhabditis elegans]|eukprot:NP_503856.2 Serpentine Receptor, class T [Caenorhabditis elegans]